MVTTENKTLVDEVPVAENMHTAAPKRLSLRRNASWVLAGNLIYAACQWGMLVVLAKLGSQEMVGQFVLALAVTAPIIVFANLQLDIVLASDAKQEYQFRDYLGIRLITTGVAFAVIAAVPWVVGYRRETALVIMAMGVAKAFEAVSEIVFGLLQQRERMDRSGRLRMIKGPLSLLAMATAMYLTRDVFWTTLALAGAFVFCQITFEFPSALWVQGERDGVVRPRFNPVTMRRLAWLALPLGVFATLISFETNIPRYVIEHFFSEKELGTFAAIAYLIFAGRTVVKAVTRSSVPRLARLFSCGDISAFRRLLAKLIGFCGITGTAGVALAVLAGREILAVVYGPEYALHTDVLIWLVVAGALRFIYEGLDMALRAMRRFRLQLGVQVMSTSLMTALGVLLISRFGLLGAAWSVLIVTSINLVVFATIVLLTLQRKENERYMTDGVPVSDVVAP